MARSFLHTQPIKATRTAAATIWQVVAAVFVLKLVLLSIDGRPKVLLGDSASYVYTAIARWVPADRSFTYGLFLRGLAELSPSFQFFVFVQVMLSAGSAALVGFALERYAGASKRIALTCALLCAIEPLQLVYERFILTETVATFLFAVLVTFAFRYLRHNDLAPLLVIPVVGAAAVSIRVSLLPPVLATSVLLPLLSPAALRFWTALRARSGTLAWQHGRVVLAHLALLIVLTNSSLSLYKTWYGEEIGGPPAYIEESGLFLLSGFAPLLEPADFVDPELRRRVFEKPLLDLHNPYLRNAHRFAPNGLSQVLLRILAPDQLAPGKAHASDVARAVVVHAIRRDPAAFFRLFEQNLVDYFSWTDLRRAVLQDQFRDQPIAPGTQAMFKTYGFNEPRQPSAGLAMIWEEHFFLWCMFLILLPALASAFLFVPGLVLKTQLFLLVIYAWLMWGLCTVGVVGDAPRYLTALAWLFFLIMGVVWTGLAKRRKA